MLTYIIHVLYNGYTYIAIRVYVCGMTHAHVYYMTVDSTETNMVLLEINSRKKKCNWKHLSRSLLLFSLS